MARESLRWVGIAALGVTFAALGVLVAAWATPPPEQPVADPVVVSVTTTATAHPSPSAAPVVSPAGVDLASHSIDDPASIWVVVNKNRPLSPLEYAPSDLTGDDVPGAGELTQTASQALEMMYAAASEAGAPFLVSTGFRSYNFQKGIFAQYVQTSGVEGAETYSARPGFSEHQTGLATDLYDPSGCHLKACFAQTPSGKWLAKHAADFGFIERYPDGESGVTGYTWEPWHWRYVGSDLAKYMRDANIKTLEEVFDLPAAPDYD